MGLADGKVREGQVSDCAGSHRYTNCHRERFVQLAKDKQLWFDIHSSYGGSKPNSLPTARVGPVTSGSAVLTDERLLNKIKEEHHRKLRGVDMELYGMYTASRDSSPPNPITFGMKSVCDYSDSNKSDRYQSYAAHVSARALAAFRERYAVDFLDGRSDRLRASFPTPL